MSTPVIQQGEVLVRHIVRDDTSPHTLLGKGMTGTFEGVNGTDGWQAGSYERRIGEEGAATLRFPNAVGSDGRLHRERFAVITDRSYRPGDEWIEVYLEHELLFVGTPTAYRLSRSTLELAVVDGFALLKKQRDTAAAFNLHGPRDLIRDYCSAWTVVHADEPDEQIGVVNEEDAYTTEHRITDSITVGNDAEHWQVIATASVDKPEFVNPILQLHVGDTDDEHALLTLDTMARLMSTATGVAAPPMPFPIADIVGGEVNLTLEGRGPWIYAYLNGQLVGVIAALTATESVTVGVSGWQFRLTRLIVRQRAPYMRDDVDTYALPGVPPATGVRGKYVTNVEDYANAAQGWQHNVLAPTKKPFATDQRATLELPRANPPTWVPAGGGTEHFAARWVGAIYLPLADVDIALRLYDVDNVARIWIGSTRFASPYIATPDWAAGPGDVDGTLTGEWLLAGSTAASAPAGAAGHLAGESSGWYPLILELRQFTQDSGVTLEQQRSDDLGTWTPADTLSPAGVIDQYARYDSFYEQIQAASDAYGYQLTVEPRSLESGAFPGIVKVAARLGRDTDKELDGLDATGIQVDVNAEELVDALLVDGSGVSDTEQAAQLTLETFNVASLGEHVLHHQDVESLSDITDETLLEQRATSIAILRDSAWEQVAAQPAGTRELRDTFPLTGDLAELRWQPGDGIRLNLEEIAVVDRTPRQIMGVQWPLVPAGIGAPTIAFRQRPRGPRETIRRLQRRLAVSQRTPQGQIVAVTGSVGGWSGTTPGGTLAGAVDAYSRVPMPPNPADIVAAWLVVTYVEGAVSETITVNTVDTGITVTAPGRYPITAYAAKDPNQPARMIAALTTPSVGQVVQYQLEIHVRTGTP